MKWAILAAMIVAITPLTDYLVDRQFKPVAYSQTEIDALSTLVSQAKTKAEQKAERKKMTKKEVNEAMLYLWGTK